MDAITCFCSGDLCNDQHFCDDCAVGSSLKCNSGTSGIHGFPVDLVPADCDDGTLNCAKITGSKLELFYFPSFNEYFQQ